MNQAKHITAILLLMGLFFFTQQTLAATLAVTPNTINYLTGSNASLNVTWAITTTGNGGGGATSRVGTFTSAPNVNSPIGIGNGTLSLPTPAIGTATVGESFTIPPIVLNTAQRQNLTTIYYYREFDNVAEGLTGPAFVQINFTQAPTPTPSLPTNTQSILTLERIALRFNDNSVVKLVKSDSLISAVAEIRYSGTGLLDAIWEVATPASTLGAQSTDRLIYTPLRSVRQYLGAGGRIYLQSPRLPSDAQGNYVVRLRVRQPATLNFTQPILRYGVNESGDELPGDKRPPITVSAPANNALLQADTLFRWQPVRGARAYQLELYLAKDHRSLSSELSTRGYDETSIEKQSPASGLLVPGKKTSLTIGVLSRQHLRHGETYLWRILAIGNDGQILSSSPVREIRIP